MYGEQQRALRLDHNLRTSCYFTATIASAWTFHESLVEKNNSTSKASFSSLLLYIFIYSVRENLAVNQDNFSEVFRAPIDILERVISCL